MDLVLTTDHSQWVLPTGAFQMPDRPGNLWRVYNVRFAAVTNLMPLIEILLPEYDREIAITDSLITVAHSADLRWRPTADQRNLSELIAHAIEVTGWTEKIMAQDSDELGKQTEKLPAHSIAVLQDSFHTSASAGRVQLVGKTDDELTADWTLLQRGRKAFSLPRISAIHLLVLSHLIHHRGQLSTYLLMQDIHLPPIYGSTSS